jgi:Flp pilus assembly pilin Flp
MDDGGKQRQRQLADAAHTGVRRDDHNFQNNLHTGILSEQGRHMIKELLRDEEGQSTVEYMLLISVIVIAIVAAAYVFIEPFKQGVLDLAKDIKKILSDGKIGRVGTTR